jgi:hypothetical protein
MKKVLWLLLAGVMVLGAKNAMADAVIASQQQDARFVSDVDIIFLGYANKIVEYKNTVDFRLNNAAGAAGAGVGEWGGAVDGKHEDIGVIGVYINRPFTPTVYNGAPSSWTPTGGSGVWSANAALGANFFESAVGAAVNGSGIAGRALNYLNLAGANVVLTPANKVDIFWGKDSGNSNLGIHINYADNMPGVGNITTTDSETAPPVILTNTTQEAQALGADLGLGFKSDSGFFSEMNIHAGFSLGSFNFTSVQTTTAAAAVAVNNDSVKDNGIFTATAGVLAIHDIDKDSSMHMFLDAGFNNFGTKVSVKTDGNNDGNYNNFATDADYENTLASSGFIVALGLGCDHKVNDGAAVFSSGLILGYASASSKPTETISAGAAAPVATDLLVDELDASALNLSWRASVDTKVASWLNVRAGISKNIFNRTTAKAIGNRTIAVPVGTTATASSTGDPTGGSAFSTGFGIHWQNWVLNTTVTAASLEAGILTPNVGGGLLFPGTGGEGLLLVSEMDLGYAF